MKPNVLILTISGCHGCEQVKKSLDELEIPYKTINIEKNPEILQKYAVMTAPGIVINEKLEFTGVPTKEELKKKLFQKKHN